MNVKLDLPDKKQVVRKLEERRQLRRARRFRNCRRRPKRFDNRRRQNWLAPSQAVIVSARLKVLRELCRIYPVHVAGVEDVCFNHAKHRWGQHFSTVEIGKERLREFFRQRNIRSREFQGYETKALREKYGYRKTSSKSADKFTAHCSDSLALAAEVSVGRYVAPGLCLVVDDSYHPVRRRLHDKQFSPGGVRHPYSRGSIFGTRKGVLIGLRNGGIGQLCGENKGAYRYYRTDGKRGQARAILWISNHLVTKGGCGHSPVA